MLSFLLDGGCLNNVIQSDLEIPAKFTEPVTCREGTIYDSEMVFWNWVYVFNTNGVNHSCYQLEMLSACIMGGHRMHCFLTLFKNVFVHNLRTFYTQLTNRHSYNFVDVKYTALLCSVI